MPAVKLPQLNVDSVCLHALSLYMPKLRVVTIRPFDVTALLVVKAL